MQVLRVGPIFENSLYIEMQFFSLLLFDVTIMLNIQIVSLFFKSHPWLHDANKQIRFLKMIVTEKVRQVQLFLKHDCGLLYTFYGSVFLL